MLQKNLILALSVFGLVLVGRESFAELEKIDRLSNVSKDVAVRVDYFVDQSLNPVGEIIDAFRQAEYLTERDRVYVRMNDPASVGDRFTIIRDLGRISSVRSRGSAGAKRFAIRGFLRITRVFEDAVEAVVYNVSDDVQRGDQLIPYRANTQSVQAREPESDIRGIVMAGAEDTGIIGSFELSFLNRGSKHGLRLNDRLVIYRRATETGRGSSAVEIPIATLVVVNLTENFATAYTLSSEGSFEPGSTFKTDRAEVRYLE
ncbi:MAG: hypothetical protein EA369_08320 [Bradymonadales bacterium]|nr:MAG: hypothetical protein EA369_08320 [Bradymonadales bacterium]